MPLRIVISINTAWNIANFRAGLIRALKANDCDVIGIAPPDAHVAQVVAMGCRFVPLYMDSKGTHPLRDAGLLLRYVEILRREKPDAFLGFTIKPNIYGSMAAQACGIPVINNVSGLGTAFIRNNLVTHVVKSLYRLAFAQSGVVFFQNKHDRRLFIEHRLVSAAKTALLPGSGVDLERFGPAQPVERQRGGFRFLLPARLLYDKGVSEYVEAARILKARRPEAVCALLGFLDVNNPSAVPRKQVERWVGEGVVDYLGAADDVRQYMAAADCVVLPSYREGTSRTLLEAAAMAKPIITTDVPGCREAVEHGRTGLICRVRDAEGLAAQMVEMIDKTEPERRAMGAAGREKMEREFDERFVIDMYLKTIESILNRHRKGFKAGRMVVKNEQRSGLNL